MDFNGARPGRLMHVSHCLKNLVVNLYQLCRRPRHRFRLSNHAGQHITQAVRRLTFGNHERPVAEDQSRFVLTRDIRSGEDP